MRTDLAEMDHPQPPTPVSTYNTVVNSILNVTAKQKIYRAIVMQFYGIRDRIQQNHFHILWEQGQ